MASSQKFVLFQNAQEFKKHLDPVVDPKADIESITTPEGALRFASVNGQPQTWLAQGCDLTDVSAHWRVDTAHLHIASIKAKVVELSGTANLLRLNTWDGGVAAEVFITDDGSVWMYHHEYRNPDLPPALVEVAKVDLAKEINIRLSISWDYKLTVEVNGQSKVQCLSKAEYRYSQFYFTFGCWATHEATVDLLEADHWTAAEIVDDLLEPANLLEPLITGQAVVDPEPAAKATEKPQHNKPRKS